MKWLKLLPFIGIIIFVYLLFNIGLPKIFSTIAKASPLVILVVPMAFVIVFLQLHRWISILKKQKISLPYLVQLKIHLMGLFYAFITPSPIGSLARSAYIKKYTSRSIPESTTSTVIERILDLICVLSLPTVGSLFLITKSSKLFAYIVIIFAVVVLFSFVIFGKKRIEKIYGILQIFIPKRFKIRVRGFIDAFYCTMLMPSQLLVPFVFTLLSWLVIYTTAYITALSLSVKLNWFIFISVYAISTIVSALPITISGLGTREITLVLLFKQFGILPETMISIALIGLFFVILIPSLIGGIIALTEK